MFNKLRSQLLLILLFFSAINVIIIVAYIYQSHEKKKIDNIEKNIHKIEVIVHDNAQLINNFFTYEPTNPDFYIKSYSPYIDNFKKSNQLIYYLTTSLTEMERSKKIDDNELILYLKKDSELLTQLVDSVYKVIMLRGFLNYGVVGEMRKHAHKIENEQLVSVYEILMLRRHEKDYLIRHDSTYIKLFNKRIIKNVNNIKANSNLSSSQQNYIITELESYQSLFKKVIELDKLIGKKYKESLHNKIANTIEIVLFDAGIIRQNFNNYIDIIERRLKTINYIILFLTISLSIYLSFKLSKVVTNRISSLSENIAVFISSCFTSTTAVPVKQHNDEVGILIDNFELLKQKIIDQINYLEVKVKQRTEEINSQKEQIQVQNKKLMDSLKYALNIQEAILPDKENLKRSFPEHFILYKPRDLVSGDFYWHKYIKKNKCTYSIFAVGDCTGHGVPGAFMSMLGIAFLNEISLQRKFKSSGDILDRLRTKIIETLSQQYKARKIEDGLDISLIIVNHTDRKIEFSGAQRDLYVSNKGKTLIYKGDRMPISKHLKDNESFSTIEFKFNKGEMFYLFSDGFADQFGGDRESKYLRKRLRNLLTQISYFPTEKQKLILNSEINAWMGNLDQTDDICLAGIRMQ